MRDSLCAILTMEVKFDASNYNTGETRLQLSDDNACLADTLWSF